MLNHQSGLDQVFHALADPTRRALIERAITKKTRALLPVHIHGMPCQIDEVLAIGRKPTRRPGRFAVEA